MRVRMLVGITGTRDGAPWPPVGETMDLPPDEATSLIRNKIAKPADDEPGEATSASDSAADADWSSMTKAQLVAELDTRGLSTSGTKAELVARLEEVAS